MDSASRDNNERQVLDPITHLPLAIHDVTDVELEQIPLPLSTSEDRRRAAASASQRHRDVAKSNLEHHEMEQLVNEVTHKGWWHDPGADPDHTRMQAAVVAGAASGIGAMTVSILWWFFGLFVDHSKGFSWLGLLAPPLGCCFLALLVGFSVLSFKVFQAPPNSLPPYQERKSHPTSHERMDSTSERYNSNSSGSSTSDSPESARWLNSLLRSIWPVVNPALFTSLTDILEDSLQSSLPKLIRGVRIADLGQGVEPVRILGIRWLSPGSAGQSVQGLAAEEGDFVNVEIALAYRAKPATSTMGLRGRSANLHLLMEFYASGGIVLPVWFELTGFLTTARLRIQLTPNPPFFALMTLTLLGQPKVTFNCTPLTKSFMNVMDIPVLSGWLQRNIDSVVGEYVAPKSTNVDLKSILMGVPRMDVDALGVMVVTIRCATGFGNADETKVFKTREDGRKGEMYVTLGWSKWGKFLWATRIVSRDGSPVWEETTAVLVNPQEVNAQESLRIQVWDADRLTADDLVGTIDVPLSYIMQNLETHNRISVRQDQLRTDTPESTPIPGKLLWECGYFDKTTLQQHLEFRDNKLKSDPKDSRSSGDPGKDGLGNSTALSSYDEVKADVEAEAERKLREAKTREILNQQVHPEGDENEGRNTGVGLRCFDQTPAQPSSQVSSHNPTTSTASKDPSSEDQRLTSEVEQQKKDDLKRKGDEIIASSRPTPHFPSGILSIRVEQISGLGVHKVQRPGLKEAGECEDEDADDLPSAYCTVLINHQRVYKTRTKMKSSNPFFDAKTEKFIRSWPDTTVIIAVRDNRLHEHPPVLGVVVLPLRSVFRDKSFYTHTLPIVGGIGYGRLKFTLIFRSVQMQLPKRLLGWDVGTLEIQPEVYAVESGALSRGKEKGAIAEDSDNSKGKKGGVVPSDLANCRLVFRTQYGKGKMSPVHPAHDHTPPRSRSNSHSETSNPASIRAIPSSHTDSTTHANTMSEPKDIVESTSSMSSIVATAATQASAEWRPKRHPKPLRLPVLKRYASRLHIFFQKHGLGQEITNAVCSLWLKDIPDEDEVVVQLPIRRYHSRGGGPLSSEGHGHGPLGSLGKVAATPLNAITNQSYEDKGKDKDTNANAGTNTKDNSEHNAPNRSDSVLEELEEGSIGAGAGGGEDIIPGVMLVVRLRFWRGLSGYHQSLVNHDRHLQDVMEALDCAEEQKDLFGEDGREEHGEGSEGSDGYESGEDLSASPEGDADRWDDGTSTSSRKKRSGDDIRGKERFEEDAKAKRKKPKQAHRKHRGLMQWKRMRNVAWMGHSIEEKADKLGHKIKSGFKHQDREAGTEKEA